MNRSLIGRYGFIFLMALFIQDIFAQEFRTASIFQDGMVLQQGMPIPVWGWASPNRSVKVELSDKVAMTVSDSTGKWLAHLPPMPYGGPFEIRVIEGDTIRSVRDVMVGEVWLASGQSNMEWTVGAGVGTTTENEIALADYPLISYYNVPKTTSIVPLQDTENGKWTKVNPQTVKDLSAVAYFFARDLYRHRKVPVGIINSSWGATSIHAWMSGEILSTHPDFKDKVQALDKDAGRWEATVHQHIENDRTRDSIALTLDEGIKSGVHQRDYADGSWRDADYPIDMDKAGLPGFWGVVWFRKTFDVPAKAKTGKATLKIFLRARDAVIYINGKEIGRVKEPEGDLSFSIPKGVVKAGGNALSVRLYQNWGIGLVGNATAVAQIEFANADLKIPLSGTWKSNGKIERALPQMQGFYNQLTVQYNARIAPLMPYAIRGVIWYQGEGNASKAFQYKTLFPLLIQDWRLRWQQGYFPFLFVQLANYKEKKKDPGEDSFAELREAQTETLVLPKTGMACAIDIGDELDIHPRNKIDVGKRLYLSARRVAYGEDIVHSGPVYESMKIDKGNIVLYFSNTGSGLVSKNEQPLTGFAIAGEDKIFHWAEATIVGNTVIVHAEKVKAPKAVRYAWASNPNANLYNREGLPAVPFRTDQYRLTTE